MPKYKRTETHKPCCKCGEIKLLSEFYSTPRGNGIWYSGRCKPCHLTHCKELRDSAHGKAVYKKWTESESGKISIKKRTKRWTKKNKQKYRVNYLTHNAIRDGRLVRQPCRICGTEPAEAHHFSYDEPLIVDWLCKSCHMKLHYPPLYLRPACSTA